MTKEICDICKKNEADKRFKVKSSHKGMYVNTGSSIRWKNMWSPYEKIYVCKKCMKKLTKSK